MLAPGLMREVSVRRWRRLGLDEEVSLDAGGGILALDGERELPSQGPATARVTAAGPRVVDVRRVLELTAR